MAKTKPAEPAADIAAAEKALLAAQENEASKRAHLDQLAPDIADAQTYAAAEAEVRHAERLTAQEQRRLADAHTAARLAHLEDAKSRFLAIAGNDELQKADEAWQRSEERLREAIREHAALADRYNNAITELISAQQAAGIRIIRGQASSPPSENDAGLSCRETITGTLLVTVDGSEYQKVNVTRDPAAWRKRRRKA